MQEIRCKNIGKIIIGHLNVNSLRNKFDALESIIKVNIDIFVVSVTKLDESFPMGQFKIDGFSTPFKIDRNKEGGGGGIIIYIRSDIQCKMLKTQLPKDIEGSFIELKPKEQKMAIVFWIQSKKRKQIF